jgi:hypothetical protein
VHLIQTSFGPFVLGQINSMGVLSAFLPISALITSIGVKPFVSLAQLLQIAIAKKAIVW